MRVRYSFVLRRSYPSGVCASFRD